LTCRETIRLALQKVRQECVDTCWMDAGAALPPEWLHCGDTDYAGGTILSCGFRVVIDATPKEVWPTIARIGGRTGYYYGTGLWKLRGLADRVLGGIGFRGGRRHPEELMVGDALDFWRVLEVEPPHRLLLLAEMKLPGEAVLDFSLAATPDGTTELRQTARFLPRGLGGILYWYALEPFHHWVYRGMLRAIAQAAKKPLVVGPEALAGQKRQRRRD